MAEVKTVTIEIDVKTGDVKNARKDFNDLNKDVNKGAKESTNSINSMSKSLGALGAAIGGAFAIKAVVGDALNRIKAFQQGMADLSAITGATGADLDKFKKAVLDVSKNTGKSATDITKAFQLVGSAKPELLASADALASVTEQAVILSQAGGIEVAAAADALTKAMNQFGAGADEAAKFTDILATSQQLGTSTIEQTSEALKNAGANANAAGLSFEETNVAIQALAKGGLVGSEAGTGLSSALIKLSTQADSKINPSLNSLTDVVEELSSRNLTLADASKLVGAESAKTLLTLVNQKDVVNDLTGELNQQGNALSQADTRMQTFNGQLEIAESSYERFILSIEDGSGALSKLSTQVLETGTNFLNMLTNINSAATGMEAIINFGSDFAVQQGIMTEAQAKFTQNIEKGAAVIEVLNTKLQDGTITREQYQQLLLKIGNGERAAAEATEGTTEALDENTTATNSNTNAKDKNLTLLEKQLKLQKDFKRELEGARGLQDEDVEELDEAEDEDFEAFVANEEKKVEAKEAARRKDKENQDALDAEIFEENLARQDQEFEDEKIRKELEEEEHQRKLERNIEIGQSAADLAGALSGLAKKGSVEAKALASIQVIINGAVAITQALAQLGPIAGALASAGIVATVGIQLNKIQSQKTLKDGEILIDGAGTETSDSIPAMLSKNESVINAKSSKKHTAALRAINDDRFEEYLNRVVMQRLYMGKEKEVSQKAAQKSVDVHIPEGYRMLNPSSVTKPIVDAIQEANFLNEGDGWA